MVENSEEYSPINDQQQKKKVPQWILRKKKEIRRFCILKLKEGRVFESVRWASGSNAAKKLHWKSLGALNKSRGRGGTC